MALSEWKLDNNLISLSVGDNEYSLKLKEYVHEEKSSVIVMCAKLESDLADLQDEDNREAVSHFMESKLSQIEEEKPIQYVKKEKING